jgi:hypothetical protein
LSAGLRGGIQPDLVCSRTTFAGTPATTQLSCTGPRTTDPAATTTLRPIAAPGSTIAPAPSQEPAPMRTGWLTGYWLPIGVSGSS